MKNKILTLVLLSFVLSVVMAISASAGFETVYNPFTSKLDYVRDSNFSDDVTFNNITVDGESVFNGAVTINSNLTVVGDVIVANVTEFDVNGSIYPGLDDTFDLGSVLLTWDNLYVNNIIFGNASAGFINSPTQSYLRVGDAGTTSHSLIANDDLLVSGKLEVDGPAYFDLGATIGAGYALTLGTGSIIRSPDYLSGGTYHTLRSEQTPDTSMLTTGNLANSIIISETADYSTDFAQPQKANPTLFIQSSNASDTDEFVSLEHDMTDTRVASGQGDVRLSAADNIKVDSDLVMGDDDNYLLFEESVNGTNVLLQSYQGIPIKLLTYTPNGTAATCYVNDTMGWVCEAR